MPSEPDVVVQWFPFLPFSVAVHVRERTPVAVLVCIPVGFPAVTVEGAEAGRVCQDIPEEWIFVWISDERLRNIVPALVCEAVQVVVDPVVGDARALQEGVPGIANRSSIVPDCRKKP